MAKQLQVEADPMLVGQANIWQCLLGNVNSMALKCAVELRIADIINSHGCPITLSEIAHHIGSPSLSLNSLSRLMRFLVQKNILDASNSHSEIEETVYTLNESSKWLLHDAELSLAPMASMGCHPFLLTPSNFLSKCIQEGGSAFKKVHGVEMWDFLSVNAEFNRVFNEGMACTTRISTKAIISEYKDGPFGDIGSLVDVGGGTGSAIAEILKAYPHIKGINFDLPHVVATAPLYDGVDNVGGDMFKDIPHADAVLMKRILHDWNDESCITILKNCRKAIPEITGKVIIVDAVLQPNGEDLFDGIGLAFDLLMLACLPGGKERTEYEWKTLLEKAGFSHYKIIKLPALESIIEAY